MELIKPGEYVGVVSDYGITTFKNGKTSAYVKVGFDGNFVQSGFKRTTLTWFGGFTTEKAAHYTLKTLFDIGFTSENIEDLNYITWPELMGKEVRISVDDNVNPNTNEVTSKIKYLNPTSKKFAAATPESLSALSWVKDVAKAVKKEAAEKEPSKAEPHESDIPF